MANKNTQRTASQAKGRKTTEGATKQESRGRVFTVLGIMIVLASAYLLLATVSHLFNWKNDTMALGINPQFIEAKCTNLCGPKGARIGHALIGQSFGLMGVLIPLVGIFMGALMFSGSLKRERIRALWHAVISITLVAIWGSLLLSTMFPNSDTFVGGWGGEFGHNMIEMLEGHIGLAGVILMLIASGVLIGIFINLNFIDFLKRTTENSVEQSKDLLSSLRDYIARKREERAIRIDQNGENDSVDENTTVIVLGGGGSTPAPNPDPEPTPTPIVLEPEPQPEPTNEDEATDEDENLEENGGEGEEITENEVSNGGEQSGDEGENSSDIAIEVITHTPGQVSTKEADKNRPFNPDCTPDYKFPTVDFLVNHENGVEVTSDEIELNKQRIEETLGNFGVPIISMTATIGPTVTLYEIVQEPGVKISRVQGLEKDIAQSLKAKGIRIIAPIPGKGTIGIEVPNINKETVSMRSAIQSKRFQDFKGELPVVIGRTIQNENFVFDLAKMPHLLVAGATGQGKSVGLNAILASLLYRKDPSQLKFVLIDPKTVEFSLYAKLEKHYLAKMESEEKAIVTDSKKAVYTLNSLCVEMENRLKKCGDAGARNIVEYNDLVRKRKVEETEIMPYIVVVIDEYADLVMTAKEVEQPVMRLAQKARAIGIHLIVATQRPDVKVITGTIKANFPARIAFRVMQMIDSRTIIDQPGAQQLIGRGDMLISNNGELTRVQCAFVDTPEVRDIVEHISEQPFPFPSGTYLLPDYEDSNSSPVEPNFGSESGPVQKFDEHFADVARDAVASGRFSTSYIQSVYGVGFNRAGRITRQLEQAGIIGPSNGSKARDVRIYDLDSLEALLQQLGVE